MICKIAISGAPSSGKTTLSSMVTASTPNSILIEEHAWQIRNLFPRLNWGDQIVRDYMLFSQIVREHSLATNNNLTAICDSGVVDSIAHSIVFGNNPRYDLLHTLSFIKYDMVFICDHSEVKIIDNGVRITDPQLRNRLQESIIDVAKTLGFPFIIIHGTPNERMEYVHSWVTNHKLRSTNYSL